MRLRRRNINYIGKWAIAHNYYRNFLQTPLKTPIPPKSSNFPVFGGIGGQIAPKTPCHSRLLVVYCRCEQIVALCEIRFPPTPQ